jgi:predicted permease
VPGVYRLLLRCFPASFRRRFGDDMAALFADRHAAARRLGRTAVAMLWIRTIADVVGHGLSERRAVRRTEGTSLAGVWQDVGFALRSSRWHWRFHLLTTLTLGRGGRFFRTMESMIMRPIARSRRMYLSLATTLLTVSLSAFLSTFAVVEALYLRDLPFPDSGRLFELAELREGQLRTPELDSWARLTSSSNLPATLAGWRETEFELQGTAQNVELTGLSVTTALPELLGLELIAGRPLAMSDGSPGAEPVIVLSRSTAASLFGDHPAAVGSPIRTSAGVFTVVGVVEQIARFPPGHSSSDFLTPLRPAAAGRVSLSPKILIRLASNGDLDLLESEVLRRLPDADLALATAAGRLRLMPLAVPGANSVNGSMALFVHVSAAALLLVALVNISQLMLLHLRSRSTEFAIRVALGASFRQMTARVLRDILLIGGISLLLALAISAWLIGRIQSLLELPDTGLRGNAELNVLALELALGFVVAFVLLASVVVGQLLRTEARQSALKLAGSLSPIASRRPYLPKIHLFVQLALTIPPLVAALLLAKSYGAVHGRAEAFGGDGLADVQVRPAPGFQSPADIPVLLERVRALPNVIAAAVYDAGAGTILRPGRRSSPFEGPGTEAGQSVRTRDISTGYFETLGIAVMAGRTLTDTDSSAAVINQAAADRYWPSGDAIGSTILLSREKYQIVGIVANAHLGQLLMPVEPEFFRPQRHVFAARLVFRTSDHPRTALGGITTAVREISPSQALSGFDVLADALDATVQPYKTRTVLLAGLAGVAMFLSVAGVLSVSELLFRHRRPEIGVRMALGASRAQVVVWLARSVVVPAIAGLSAGTALYLTVAHVLEATLFGVQTADTAPILGACALMALATMVAAASQAARVSDVDLAAWIRSGRT